jgi:hypothetical protein
MPSLADPELKRREYERILGRRDRKALPAAGVTPKTMRTAIHVLALVVLAVALWWLKTVTFSTKLQGLLMVLAAVLLGDIGLKLTRRLVPFGMLRRHSAAQTAIFAVVGTVYGLIAAFAIVAVWQDYTDANTVVAQEANALGALEHMSRGFDVVTKRQVQEAARTYAYQIIDDEWPAMARGRDSERVQGALTELWQVYTDMAKHKKADQSLYERSIFQLTEMDTNRRARLAASQERIPTILWLMLYSGALSTLVLAYLFESPNDWFQRLVVALLAATTMFSVFLCAALEGPFDGDISVSSKPFQYVIDHMQNLER